MNYLECIKTINCSALFLTQCVGVTAQNKIDYNFVNSYLYDEAEPLEGDYIYLVFRPRDKFKFSMYVENEQWRSTHFVKTYDIGDFSVLVYALPNVYKSDYEKFKAGKYSEFSEDFKLFHPKMIQKTIKMERRDEVNLSYLIINRDEALQDYWEELFDSKLDKEVWTIPDMEKEKLKRYEFVTTSIN